VPEIPVPEVTEPATEADTRAHSVVPGMTLEPELVPAPEPSPAAETVPAEETMPAEETVLAEETIPAAAAVWEDDAPAETLDAPEPEVTEARSSAESESEASADESPASESPASGQPTIIGSRPLDYWDAGEDDIPGASVVPAAHDTADPAPAADDGDEVVEYSDEEESPAPATPELPFFSAPALRRMRSTPVPPGEDSEEDPAGQP
jgi:hypothetical protein